MLVAHFIAEGDRPDFYAAIRAHLSPGAPFVSAEISHDLDAPSFAPTLETWKKVQTLMGATPESLDRLPVDNAVALEEAVQETFAKQGSMVIERAPDKAVRSGFGRAGEQFLGEQAGECGPDDRAIDAAFEPKPGRHPETEFEDRLAHERREATRSHAQTMDAIPGAHDQVEVITLAGLPAEIEPTPGHEA